MTLTQINKAGLDELALDHVFTIGASGTDHYTFQGEGLNGTVNDPTLYLTRGKTYRFENGTGAHPIRIQSTSGASGTAYNTGVTNNAGSGTVIVEVQHDAPDVLYYQCTSHANMNGILYITGALADGGVTTAKLADDAVTDAKLANSINTAIAANTAKTSNATHTGDVTGSTSLTIANDAVTTAKIADDAVDADKLASNAVVSASIVDGTIINGDIDPSAAIAGSKIVPTFTGTTGVKVPVGTTGERVNTQGMVRFNTTLGLLEYYDGTSWRIVDVPPVVASVNSTNLESTALPTNLVITGSNFSSAITVKFIGANGTKISAGTTTRDSATQITAQVPNTLTSANEPYTVEVTNDATSLVGILSNAFNIDAAPAFTVAAGSLGTLTSTASASGLTTVAATDDEGDSISFSVTAGSLPSGITFNSNGTFSGTAGGVSSSTTSTFTVTATDGTNTSTRQYSILVNPTFVQLSGSGTFTVPSGINTAEILIVGGGGSGTRSPNVSGGGGGAGGIVHRASYTFTSTDKTSGIAYSVGNGGTGVGLASDSEAYEGGYNVGANTTFAISTGTITANGGGCGQGFAGVNSIKPGFSYDTYFNGVAGGSGGGGAWEGTAGTASNQPTFSGWTSYGNSGGSRDGYAGGGGGGAGAAGGDATGNNDGGDGGAGQLFSSFTAYGASGYFGGGGGGGSNGSNSEPQGGTGGGGNGGYGSGSTNRSGKNGTNGTGSGGGGSRSIGYNNYTYKSGNGGHGTILIKY